MMTKTKLIKGITTKSATKAIGRAVVTRRQGHASNPSKTHLRRFDVGVSSEKLFAEYLAIERLGVSAKSFLNDIDKLQLPRTRVFQIFNIPKSTATRKNRTESRFEGTAALASIRLAKLLSMSERIISRSLHPDAKYMDAGQWLGEWIERSQPALGGLKPSQLLDTETGGQCVIRVLAALESGSYQ